GVELSGERAIIALMRPWVRSPSAPLKVLESSAVLKSRELPLPAFLVPVTHQLPTATSCEHLERAFLPRLAAGARLGVRADRDRGRLVPQRCRRRERCQASVQAERGVEATHPMGRDLRNLHRSADAL